MRLGLRYIVSLCVCTLLLLGAASQVRAAALCTDAVGGVVQLDAAGADLGGQTCVGDLVIDNAPPVSHLTGATQLTVTGNLTLNTGATLHIIDTPSAASLDVGGNFTLQTGAKIIGTGAVATGLLPIEPVGGAGGAGMGSNGCGGSGGGHGGSGGNGATIIFSGVAGGLPYDSQASPQLPGSDGGFGFQGATPVSAPGRGGAAIRINVVGVTLLDGLIDVGGDTGLQPSISSPGGGGGSGGSILLSTGDLATSATTQTLKADGGDGGSGFTFCDEGAGGGGGRIAVYFSGTNGGVLGAAVDVATHVSCVGGLKGAGSTSVIKPGSPGTCLVSQASPAPVVVSASPSVVGKGVSAAAVTVTGTDFATGATLEIIDPLSGAPASGVTIVSQGVTSSTSIDLVLAVDYTVDETPAANPKLLRVTNPDLKVSADVAALTISPAPVISPLVLTPLARGFSGVFTLTGNNFQPGATVVFNPPVATFTGPMVVTQTAISVPFTISQAAIAQVVSISVTNPDGGVTQTPASLQVLSEPQISAVTPNQLTVGQGPVTITVDGTGFVANAQVVTIGGGLTVLPGSTQFVSFTQLTAQVSADVNTDLTVSNTRDLWVDNNDGGVSAPVPFQLLASVGVNNADMLSGEVGVAQPQHRRWNGYGWTAVSTIANPIPHTPEWLVSRPGLTAGSLLVASLGSARDLYLQERTSNGANPPVLTWQAPLGPITVPTGLTPRRPLDVAPVSGVGGERFLAVYGSVGGGLSYQTFGVAGPAAAVTQVDPACAGVDEVVWLRLVANDTGTEAVLTYAKENEALCAIVWRNGGFDAATEIVLAGATTLSSLSDMAFDAVYWGAAGDAMVAWGRKGLGEPATGYWNGTVWSTGNALNVTTTALSQIAWIRLAASPSSDRVALASSTTTGALLAQYWNGLLWGATVTELPFPLVDSPDSLSSLNGSRPFDVGWSTTLDKALLVYGIAPGVPTPPVAPVARTWSVLGGWETPRLLDGAATRQEARWVRLAADPSGGDLLATVVDLGVAAAGTGGTLNTYQWDGLNWAIGKTLPGLVPDTGEAVSVDYRSGPPPVPPTVTSVSYNAISPVQIGANSSRQLLDIVGQGFLNVPTVQFSDVGIAVDSVVYISPLRINVTVSIGAVVPGSYGMSVLNPDGGPALFNNAIQVLAAPGAIRVVEVSATPCLPTLAAPTATACATQDSVVNVEVRGSGIVSGATAVFDGVGVNFIGTPVFSIDPLTTEGVLAGAIQVNGSALRGPSNVTVTNPDSSTGVGSGVFEVLPLVSVASISPTGIGAGAVGGVLTVSGQNFQPGVVFDLGAGVSVRGVVVVSSSAVQLTVDVQNGAPLGGHSVTVSNLDGATFTSPVALFSVLEGIAVSNLSPSSGIQGTTVPVSITGTGLGAVNTPAKIQFSGLGLTATNIVATATILNFDLVITDRASFDTLHDLTLIGASGAQLTLSGVFKVEPDPVITTISPTAVVSGETGIAMIINGTGFDPGAVVIADPGVRVTSQTVVSDLRIDISIDVTGAGGSSSAVSVTNPNGRLSAPQAIAIVAPTALSVASGTTQITASSVLSYASITVTGGELRIVGDTTVNVTGNVTVSGGQIVFDPDQTYGRLKVAGAMIVDALGAVRADGTGFPGGTPGTAGAGLGGGNFAGQNTVPGAFGGGYGGAGGVGNRPAGAATYDILGVCTPPACFDGMPLSMGSGGGSGFNWPRTGTSGYWRTGGPGGGAFVLDIAGNLTVNGVLSANGVIGVSSPGVTTAGLTIITPQGVGSGGGSGGSILVLAGGSVTGSVGGRIEANGGNASAYVPPQLAFSGTGGGGGRVAVYAGAGNTFSGAMTCDGGASTNPAVAYAGSPGTCLSAPLTTVASLTPAAIAQGGTIQPVIQGTNLLVGDTVLFTDPSLTGGLMAASGIDFTAPISASATAQLGGYDVVVRHVPDPVSGASFGGIAFDGISVSKNPAILSLTPNHLVAGAISPVTLNGGLLDAAGAQVSILRNGLTTGILATVNSATSSPGQLALQVNVPAGTATGGYDVVVSNSDGGQATLANGLVVTSVGANVPAPASISPGVVPAGTINLPITVFGYDFGVPAAFTVPVLTTSDANVILTLDPAGCPGPGNTASCEALAGALQHIDALATTTGAISGTLVDVTVTQGGVSGLLPGGLTISAAPTITALVPNAAVGTFTLTVSGTGFQTGAIITVDDPAVQVGLTTQVGANLTATVTVPVGEATRVTNVRVTNLDGGVGLSAPWTLNPVPLVTSLSPLTAISPGLSASIDIAGAYFHPNALVEFGAGVVVSAPVFIDSGHLQVLVSPDLTAQPGLRTVTVRNHPSLVAGALVDGFEVKGRLILQSVTPNAVGVGAGTASTPATSSLPSMSQGLTLLIRGQEFSTSMRLGDIGFSNSEVVRLNRNHDAYSSSDSSAINTLTNARFASIPGGPTIASAGFLIKVNQSASTGVGSLSISSPDGSSSSVPFVVNPAPVVSTVTPNTVTQGDVVDLVIRGFGFDPLNPQICFGDGCRFSADLHGVTVLDIRPQHPNRVDVTVAVDRSASPGSISVKVLNPDGGFVDDPGTLHVVASFGIDAGQHLSVAPGATSATTVLTGTGFAAVPSTPQLSFLTASGLPDATVTANVVGSSVTSTTLSYTVTATAGAVTGARTLVMTNGDGAQLEVKDFLLVSNPVGPTAGHLWLPDGGDAYRAPEVGKASWYDRVITDVLLTGSGFSPGALTLAFDDPALTVTNLTVIDAASATFDLTIGATALPGSIGMSATIGADTNHSADMLTLVTAPLVTSTNPSLLVPGTSNVSVTVDGGGFDPLMDALLCRAMDLPGNALNVRHTVASPGFVPDAGAVVEWLLPSGLSDPAMVNRSVVASTATADSVDLVFDVTAAAPGLRSLRITNTGGATLVADSLVVITGRTKGAGGFALDVNASACNPEMAQSGSVGNRIALTGAGFTETPSAIQADFLLPSGVVDTTISTTVDALLGATSALSITFDVSAAAASGYRTLRITNGDNNVLKLPDFLLVSPTGTTNGAGAIPFVSLRDFDSDRIGRQVSWLGTTTLRTVADVGVLALGDYYLQLTGANGGATRAYLPVPPKQLGTPAKFAYLSGVGSDGLHIRDWLGAMPVAVPLKSAPVGSGSLLPHNSTRQDLWTELRANPMNPGEYMLAIGQANTAVVAASGVNVYNQQPGAAGWTEVAAVGSLPIAVTRGFDLAYEHAGSGRALMVYGLGSSLWVKTFNGTAPVVSAPVVVAGAPSLLTSGQPIWVRMIPQKDSQRILVVYETDAEELNALIWDGAANSGVGAFISQYSDVNGGPLTRIVSAAPATLRVPGRSFDGAWESTSGRAVVFFGEKIGNEVRAVTWDPQAATWGGISASVGLNAGLGTIFLEAEAAPTGDRIAVLSTIPRAGEPALAYFFYNNGWEGLDGYLDFASAFRNTSREEADRNFDLDWDSRGRLIVLYTSASNGSLRSRIWDPANLTVPPAAQHPANGWGIAVEPPFTRPTGSNANSAGAVMPVFLDIAKDPESDELIAILVDEGGSRLNIQAQAALTVMLRWNGYGWSDRTQLDDAMGHWAETSQTRIYGTSAAVAYHEDLAPPQAVVVSPSGQIGATSVEVQWTAPGDNGASGTAGGYDIRWAVLEIVADNSVPDCALLNTQICFSDATQVPNPPTPVNGGTVQTVNVDFGASGVYWVAVKSGDRPNRMGTNGEIIPWRNVSAMSNALRVVTVASDPVPPETIVDLAVVPGANPSTMVVLTWTGVGDDAGVVGTPPVLGYDIRIAPLPISEVGGVNNFATPFDQVTNAVVVAPAMSLGSTRGVANSYTVTGLLPNTDYYFAVKGFDEDPTIHALISNVVTLRTDKVTPVAIDDLIVVASNTNSVTLEWTARGGGTTSYDLRVALDTIVDDFATVQDCANMPAGQICMSRAFQVLNTPVPAADGVRQTVLVQGLAPATQYRFSLVPVSYSTTGGVLIRQAPLQVARVTANTVADSGGTSVKPAAVSDLAVIGGSVRTHEVGLSWTAPNAPDARAGRYELLWSTKLLSGALSTEIRSVWLPLLPSPSGVHQEFVLKDLPENAVLHVALRSYSVAGVASSLSNEVRVHTALRPGFNAVSVPGSLLNDDINALFGGIVGSCPSNGVPTNGTGPVGACGNGEVPLVTAFRWDPALGVSGDFVAVNVTDAAPDPLAPGDGLFLQATGTQAVLDGLEGFDLPSFGRMPLPTMNAALVSNPYRSPVAVANLRIIGIDGAGGEVFNQAFGTAAGIGVINPDLAYHTAVNGVEMRVPVTVADELLPYRAYFIQLGGAADPALNYFVEVPHP